MASRDDRVIDGIRKMNLAYKKLLRVNLNANPGFLIKHLTREFGSGDEAVTGKEDDDDDSIIGRIKTIFEIFHTLEKFDPQEASDILLGNLDGILSEGQAIEPVQSELKIESVKTVENGATVSPNWNITIPSSTSSSQDQTELESEDTSSIIDDSPPFLEPGIEFNNVQLIMNPVVQLIPPGLRLKCTICKSKCFSSPEILNFHIQTHAEENMERQLWIIQPRKIHICPICGKKCRVPSTLKDHIRTHTKSKPFICPICSSRFTQKGSCKNHMVTLHKSKLDPIFEAEDELPESQDFGLLKVKRARKIKNSHFNLRKNRKPIFSYSKLTASIKNTKKKFKTLPPSRRPQKCTYCQRSFNGITNLRVHLRIHTGEKPYSCPYSHCMKRFNQSGACKSHVARHERPYPCEYCTRAFFTQSSRDSHVKSCHADSIQR